VRRTGDMRILFNRCMHVGGREAVEYHLGTELQSHTHAIYNSMRHAARLCAAVTQLLEHSASETPGAAAAQECVRACAHAGDTQLVSTALGDELVEPLGAAGGGGELPRAARRAAERARVLAAVRAPAPGPSCPRVAWPLVAAWRTHGGACAGAGCGAGARLRFLLAWSKATGSPHGGACTSAGSCAGAPAASSCCLLYDCFSQH
jgi:hypothetical protein